MKCKVPGIFILCLNLLFSTALSQQKRGMHTVIKDPETSTDIPVYDESWAIVIGINKYQNVKPLNYAVADAFAIQKLLIEQFGFKEKNVVLLADENASQEKIKKALGDLYNVGQNDRVVIYFAGHGETIDLPSGGALGFLVPVDGRFGNNSELYATCISMQTLRELSSFIPAKHVLFLVDACYGGLAASGARALTTETTNYMKKITAAKVRQVITAGGKGEEVLESSDWGHSAFTYKLIDGLGRGLADLDGDGLVRGSELATYIQRSVSVLTRNSQTPQSRFFSEDEGDFIFVLPEADKSHALALGYGDVLVTSIPSGADISIDEKATDQTSPADLPNIPEGEHTVELRKGNVSARQTLTVYANKVAKVTLSLKAGAEAQTGTIKVSSTPPDADVLLDGRMIGKTPANLTDVFPGIHDIMVRKEGYIEFSDKVRVRAYTQETMDARLFLPCSINVVSDPAEAQVYVDNTPYGFTPIVINNLRPGEVTIRVVKRDYDDWQENMYLTEGSRRELKPALTGKYGYIDVHAQPTDAEIYLNGEKIATGSLNAYRVKVGKQTVEVRHPSSSRSESQNILLSPGDRKTIEATFGFFSLSALWRSALVPGWGQYYDGATTKGLVFLLGSLATGAAALEFNHEYYTPRLNRYNNAREAYLNATTESDIVQYREDMNIKYSDLDKARNTRNILIAATAGFYTLNLLDAVLFHSRGSEISVLAEGKGVQLLPDVSYSQSGIHYGLQVRF